MSYRERTTPLRTENFLGVETFKSYGAVTGTATTNVGVDGALYAEDNPNTGWTMGDRTRDYGDHLYIERNTHTRGPAATSKGKPAGVQLDATVQFDRGGADTRRYVGPLAAANGLGSGDWPNYAYLSDASLEVLGSKAIARTIPTNPSADMSTMIGELLLGGVPKVVGAAALKNRFRDHRDIGGEYLNVQFGWMPLVRDLKSVSQAIVDSEKRLRQLKRDSGRLVRRRLDFPIESSVTHEHSYTGRRGIPVLAAHYYRDSPHRETTLTVNRRTWFSGAYTFHFEMSDKQADRLSNQAKRARILLGLDLTPSVLWNLTPWSWLADWVANTGDILHNASAFQKDGLVLHHGYIMSHTVAENQRTLHGITARRTGPLSIREGYNATYHPVGDVTDVFRRETKQRRRATPYGFGLNTEQFSARQWAILGALGLSRSPRSL